MKNRWIHCAALLVGALTAFHASAATVERMSAARLVDDTDLIATGTLIDEQVVTTLDGSMPFTFYTFRLEESLKGEAATPLLTLRVLGGWYGDEGVLVPGMPTFEPSERYLLFVRNNGTAVCPLLGWGQGVLKFADERASGRRVLVDEHGSVITGLASSDWTRGARWSGREHDADQPELPQAEILGDEERSSSRVPGGIADAARVLDELRQLIRTRRQRPEFVEGRLVWSADPRDVPASLGH